MIRIITIVFTAVLGGIVTTDALAGWKPVASPRMTSTMLTPWGEAITPETARREYPRPQLKRAEWISLNGLITYDRRVIKFDCSRLVDAHVRIVDAAKKSALAK